MRKSLATLSAVLMIAATSGASGQQRALVPAGGLQVFEQYLESLRLQAGIPGISAAILLDGEIVWERGFGFQNVASRIRATPDTPYLVGGISQTAAAALILQCVEQRRLSLDAPVRTYGVTLPESNASIRQLMSHTSIAASEEPFAFSPERYGQLTPIMEWCAPQPYRKSVAHRLLNRLAMKDSVPGTDFRNADLSLADGLFEESEVERYRGVLERIAVPYKVDSKGRSERFDLPPGAMTSTSGLVSTVRDLARFDAAWTSESFLLDETREMSWSQAAGRDGAPVPAGLGWFVQYYKGERLVWHYGEIPSAYSSLILKMPGRNLTLILLANSDRLSAPYNLSTGDVTKSLFASTFLRLVI
jgi:CubicO group peptidase (beta-lactamase class C family)